MSGVDYVKQRIEEEKQKAQATLLKFKTDIAADRASISRTIEWGSQVVEAEFTAAKLAEIDSVLANPDFKGEFVDALTFVQRSCEQDLLSGYYRHSSTDVFHNAVQEAKRAALVIIYQRFEHWVNWLEHSE